MKRIVVGIGGTNSRAYKRDWVKEFVDKVTFNRGDQIERFFIHGPDNKVSGLDSTPIRAKAYAFITSHSRIVDTIRRTGARNSVLSEKHLFEDEIWFISHSRGSHIAIDISKSLQKVKFLGMFDAVDRTVALGNTRNVPASVENVYHAIRDPQLASRYSFGNTGLGGVPEGNTRLFLTSHGGVGGDWGLGQTEPGGFGSDVACLDPHYHVSRIVGSDYRRISNLHNESSYDPRLVDVVQTYPQDQSEAARRLRDLCELESIAANEWMMENARRHGANIR